MEIMKIDDFKLRQIKVEYKMIERILMGGSRVFEIDENHVFKGYGEIKFKKYRGQNIEQESVEILNEHRDLIEKFLPEMVLPISHASLDGRVVGYVMKKINGMTLKNYLMDKNISIDKKIYYLKEIGNILDNMEKFRKETNIEFYINDLYENNFIVGDDSKLYVIDAESCKIANSKTLPSKALITSKFELKEKNDISLLWNKKKYTYESNDNVNGIGYFLPNKNTDMFSYYIIILNFLFDVDQIDGLGFMEYSKCIDVLEKLKLNNELIDIFRSINNDEDNKNPKHLLDHLKDVYDKSSVGEYILNNYIL